MAEPASLLELRGITKRFGPLVANRNVTIKGRPGEILGLVGENGAGKTTLMAIASGLYRPDAGAILVDGEEQYFHSPLSAIAAGIDMVHQHFMLVENLTVAENVILGRGSGGWLKRGQIEREVRELAERYQMMPISPSAPVHSLSPTEQQTVEILTALYRRSRVLILDEPTSLLGPAEVEGLFGTIRRLADEGRLIILISHKLGEVLSVSDRVSVMRQGELVETIKSDDADADQLAELMVGRGVGREGPHTARDPGEAVLEISDLVVEPEQHGSGLRGVDLNVRAGEIVGVVGVAGNGQRELAEAIIGVRDPVEGRMDLAGKDARGMSTRERLDRGLAFVDEDPRRNALLLPFSVSWNVGVRAVRSRGGVSVDYSALRELAAQLIRKLDIRGATPNTPIEQLSGGNQQKVLLARELEQAPRLLVVVNPTVGLDVAAAAFVHAAILEERDRGVAVLLISTDLDEAETLSDRLAILYRGKIAGTLGREHDRSQVGRLMAGLEHSPKSTPADVA